MKVEKQSRHAIRAANVDGTMSPFTLYTIITELGIFFSPEDSIRSRSEKLVISRQFTIPKPDAAKGASRTFASLQLSNYSFTTRARIIFPRHFPPGRFFLSGRCKFLDEKLKKFGVDYR